jgi:prolyl oligopeptidase PreP (S9A serine peptidase family)
MAEVFLGLVWALPLWGQSLEYPQTRTVDQVDDYHGTKVADPYRWLEDDNSVGTAKWVEAENKVTFAYLEKIPFRDAVKKRLGQLYNYPKYTAPVRKGELLFYAKNNGLQNQNVVYDDLVLLLAEAFSRIRKSEGRASVMRYVGRFARESEVAFKMELQFKTEHTRSAIMDVRCSHARCVQTHFRSSFRS